MYKTVTKFIICSALLSAACATTESSSSTDLSAKVAELSKEITKLQQEIGSLSGTKEPENFLELDKKDTFSSSAVTTSPTLGLRSLHNGGDLVVNFSTMNEDVRLLEQRAAFQQQRKKDELSKPLLELSGALRGSIDYSKSSNGLSSSNINLADAEIDAFAEVNRMVSGFFSLSYDSGLPGYSIDSASSGGSYYKNAWSNIYLKRGFITIGDFTKSNWYSSVGQMYVPFGKFSSFQVTSTLVSSLGKTQGRAVDIGYRTKDLIATVYGMKGTSYSSTSNPAINSWGGNVQKTMDLTKGLNLTLGAGYISNLADSNGVLGIIDDINSGVTTDRYMIDHDMPAYDLYAKLSLGDWLFNIEYLNADKSLSISDTEYGKPAALQLEVDRMFNIGSLPASIAFGYGHISDFLRMPQNSYAVSFNTYLFKDTVQSLEFRHLSANKNSSSDDLSFNKNAITAMFSMYF